jgi:hypothetical protein
MKALVLRGRGQDSEVEISQWCNDWFSTTDGRIYSPASLAFTNADFNEIAAHKNNGMLFELYRPYDLKESILIPHKDGEVEYVATFRRGSMQKRD